MLPVLATLASAAVALAPANHAAPAQKVSPRHSARSIQAANIRAANTLESKLLDEINRVRSQRGLSSLRWSTQLTAAANQHSSSMAGKGYFTHESANGGAFWRRIASFYGQRGFQQWAVGENLLWSAPDVDPAGALRMWMNSPEHRANLLDRSWREIGVSALHAARAPGVYGGGEVTIVTADFGVRS